MDKLHHRRTTFFLSFVGSWGEERTLIAPAPLRLPRGRTHMGAWSSCHFFVFFSFPALYDTFASYGHQRALDCRNDIYFFIVISRKSVDRFASKLDAAVSESC